MCGIVGFSGALSEKSLLEMNDKISHRGPDDFGHWFSEKRMAGLGHRRLSIIDPGPGGKQPMFDANERAVISYNGEIYNFKELREGLSRSGFFFKTNTDTEVIINLYLRDGHKMLKQLNGIFSFAIYDFEKNEMLIARDGMGVKPFYYTKLNEGFVFASELKSLLELSGIKKELDPRAIANYLTYLWAPKDLTPIKSVRKLTPGTAILLKEGRVEKEWSFYEAPFSEKINNISVEEAVDQLDHHLEQAVRRQMVSDVPVGAFLSGGLDSSAIVHYARKYSKTKFETFTIGQKGSTGDKDGMIDDLPYAQKVAKHLDVNLNTIWVGPEIVDSIEKMIIHLDEPQADPAALNTMLISQLAKESGVKVLLSGSGGDDILTGYRRHYALNQEKYWSDLPKGMRSLISKTSQLLPQGNTLTRRVSKALRYADLDQRDRLASYFYWLSPEDSCNLLDSKFRGELSQEDVTRSLSDSLDKISENTSPINKMLFLECKHFLTDHNLNYTDKMSMAHGVEVRVPFLDKDLVDFACALPPEFKQNGREGKWIFKKMMERYLPHEVIYRPKTGFGVPLRSWVTNELRPVIEDVLSEASVKKRGVFNYKEIRDLIDKNNNGEVDATYSIFSLLCIEIWCRSFLD